MTTIDECGAAGFGAPGVAEMEMKTVDAKAMGARPTHLMFVAIALLATVRPAFSQATVPSTTTRAALLDAARSALETQSAPPTRSSTERALYWYDNQHVLARLFARWKGFHLAGGDFPAGAGLKFGVGYDKALGSNDPDPDLPNRVGITARGAYSTMGYARGSVGISFDNLGGAPVDVLVLGQAYEFPQEDYFGTGIASSEENRTNYLLDSTEAGASARWRPRFLDFGGGVWFLNPRIGQGTDDRYPTTTDVFDPATVVGITTQPDFMRADLSAAIDWRDQPLHPHRGGRYGVVFSRFDDRDLDSYDFRRVEVSLQQYVPLPSRYRIIALRAEGVFTDADAGSEVPFYFQPTLGGARNLRGYREFRYRDQNSLLLGAEYRWEAWWAMDAAFFMDAGTVAPTRRGLAISDMKVSYGFGLRFHSNSAVVARFDLAFSPEGFVPLLRFEHVF